YFLYRLTLLQCYIFSLHDDLPISPELFVFPVRKDRGTKLLTYIADMTVNGVDGVPKKQKPIFSPLHIPKTDTLTEIPSGTKQLLANPGPEYVAKWSQEQERVLTT